MSKMFDLTGKTVLVTGAASGIGEAIAETMARRNAFVYVADVDRENGERVASAITESGGTAKFLELDLAVDQACIDIAQLVHRERGNLDILVNNAGIGHVGTIEHTTADDLDRLYSVNIRGMFNLTKAFIPKMRERKYGVLVNMSSVGGVAAVKERIAYCMTKFAVVGFTKCLALDHASEGIRANCICPGRVETPFVKARISEYPDPEKAYREMAATQALGRMGTPEEIAAAALYLASDEAAFVTGTSLLIEGGFTVGK
ncbi:MAG TPA: SDR family oxidoreductase [Pyrinomonadaceae bacterium]|nr:SDR family oxidoreductase [Pyrinomonadaceae bacterium]